MKIYSLKCLVLWAGLFASMACLANQVEASMSFKQVERCNATSQQGSCIQVPAELGDGALIFGHGRIEKLTENTFADAVKGLPPGTIVILNSLGGDLIGGLRLGQSIRARDFHTLLVSSDKLQHLVPKVVDPKAPVSNLPSSIGKCFSSCAYTFLGGMMRRVDSVAQFGVHQFRNEENKLDAIQAQKMSAMLARYLDAMGINRQLLDQALLTEPGKMTLITENLRKTWNVENGYAPVAFSRWRLEATSGGKRLAYASRKQISRNAFLTIAFAQINGQLRTLLIAKPDPRDETTSDWLSSFSTKLDLVIEVNSKIYRLSPITEWEKAGAVNTPGTRQIWFQAPDTLVRDLQSVKQFILKPQWAFPPIGMDAETYFGTEGFEDNFKAL